MMKLFGSHPEAVTNTSLIAERCNVTMNLDSNIKLLKFQVESVTDNDVYFRSRLGMSYYICNTPGKTDSFFSERFSPSKLLFISDFKTSRRHS